MAALLEMLQDHDADHVSDMKGISCRVDSDVCCCRAFHQFLLCSGHDILDHASPLKFLYKIFHDIYNFYILVAKCKYTERIGILIQIY